MAGTQQPDPLPGAWQHPRHADVAKLAEPSCLDDEDCGMAFDAKTPSLSSATEHF